MTYSIPFRCVGLLWLVAAPPLLAQKADSPVPKNAARLLLRIQADAAVDVQGITLNPTDGLRVFQITGLSPNETYRFELRATWRGKEVKRPFELRTGKITALDLTADFQAQVTRDHMPQAVETPAVPTQPPPPSPKDPPVVEPKKPIEVVKVPTPPTLPTPKETPAVTPKKPGDVVKPPIPATESPVAVKPAAPVKEPVAVEKPNETPRPSPPPPPPVKPVVKVEPPIEKPVPTVVARPGAPLAVAIKPGETCLMVIPIDRQGYTGPVTVRVEDLPAKIVTRTVSGLTSRDSVRVELSVLPGASAAVHPGRLLVAGGSNFRLERPVSVSVRDVSAE